VGSVRRPHCIANGEWGRCYHEATGHFCQCVAQ
jgi:hypothetical protein